MKKTLSVVALIAISASLVACGGEKKEEAKTEAPAVVEQPAPATTAAAPATTEAAPATTEAAPATTAAAPAAAPAAPAAAPAK